MANKNYRKERKNKKPLEIRPERVRIMVGSSLARGDLPYFSAACKALGQSATWVKRGGSGNFWHDNKDPALLAARDFSAGKWQAMAIAWKQAEFEDKAWLLPRMVFCAGKSIKQSIKSIKNMDCESSAIDQLTAFAKKGLSDLGWMREHEVSEWVNRGLQHGSPVSACALLEAMRGRIDDNLAHALAAKSLGVCLEQSESLVVCQRFAVLAQGVVAAEKMLTRLALVGKNDRRASNADRALNNKIGGYDDDGRAGSLMHAAMDAAVSSWRGIGLSDCVKTMEWLSGQGACLKALKKMDGDNRVICLMGRACASPLPGVLVQAMLDAGVDVSGSPKGAVLPLSILCSRGLTRRGGVTTTESGEMAALEALLAAGAPLEALGDEGETALHHAARAGRADFFEKLARSGAELERLDFKGKDWRQWAMSQEKAPLRNEDYIKLIAVAEHCALRKLNLGSRENIMARSVRL